LHLTNPIKMSLTKRGKMMATKNSRMFAVTFVVIFFLTGILPVQAESLVGPLLVGGGFVWAKSIGGTGSETGSSIAVDSSGNVYTTGQFLGTVDFDPGAGVSNLNSSAGSYDIFVTKTDGSGNFIWAKNMGGTGIDAGRAIAVDSSANVYITGYFNVTADFDPGAGTVNLTSAGLSDSYVSKMDSNGNFVWAKRIGGTDYDSGEGIALDLGANVYTTGSFYGTVDFNPDAGIADLTSAGNKDIYISKLNTSGSYAWARNMGGTGDNDQGYSIATDPFSNIYTTGSFSGTADFDPGANIFNLIGLGNKDIFVSKLNINGVFVWAKSMGGTNNEIGNGITVDPFGNVYTTGYFSGIVDFDPSVLTANMSGVGGFDIFVSKLDTGGNYTWAKTIGGLNDEVGSDIAVDSNGNVYTTGYFAGRADFDPGAAIVNLDTAGFFDIFISKLNSSGNYIWAKSIGGTGNEDGYSIAVASSGNIYITGYFQGTVDFDPGASTTNLVSAGSNDIFVSKLNDAPIFADVPDTYWAVTSIERLYNAGITGGCTTVPLNYCPTSPVTRAQMAIFLLRGMHGSAYTPPPATGTKFTDVPLGIFAAAWIEQLATEGITSGCGGGNYCPTQTVSRAQMAIFLVRARHGVAFVPPTATGIFPDVPVGSFGANYIEQLVADAITSGCGGGNYCPSTMVKRDSMAVFLVKTFNLP
jgi:hypothetical protein